MKTAILSCCLIFFLGCSAQDEQKEIGNNFIKDVILKESINELENFVIINQNIGVEKREKLHEYIGYVASLFKGFIEKNSSNYSLITLDELKSNKTITKEYNLKYEDNGNVLYVISGNEVITHIIFNEDQKIISFFPSISQASTDHAPVFLDTFDDFK